MALTSCELFQIETKPDVSYYFSVVEIETTENSATIDAVKPYITINGVKEEGTTIYMEYWVEGDATSVTKVETYTEANDHIFFTIEDLTPDTSYHGHITIGGAYGMTTGSTFPFTTKAHIPVAEYVCECEIDARGILANVEFTNLSFTLDGEESPLAKVEFKYSPSLSGGIWTTVELSAEEIAEGFMIPAVGEEYLKENSDYKYIVTLTPEDSNYEEYTTSGKFTTTSVALSADNLFEPTITEVENGITLSCVKPTLLIDGVEIAGYADVKYQFYYTDDNNHNGIIDAECADGMISATVPFTRFKEGVTYNFCSRMDINDINVMDSADVQYTMPIKETPAPPAPPVSGDADTTELAGQWHLTEWRGIEPSFDVYLSITEDGVVSLFQRMESRLWETFYSVVGYEDGIIAGEYTDGVAWAHSYYVTVEGNTMTWTSTTDANEISVYTRCSLPDITNPEIRVTATAGKRFL